MNMKPVKRKDNILIGIYRSSTVTAVTALAVVVLLEIFMLAYSFYDSELFGAYIHTYRQFYIVLLCFALAYMALILYVNKDMEHRFRILNIANPIAAVFFFAWSLGITWFDAVKGGLAESSVFMTFSLLVMLCVSMVPWVYAVIVIPADLIMLFITVPICRSAGPVINLFIFFIFQIVLGISFNRLKERLAVRFFEERDRAKRDSMTGFWNRRAYTEAMDKLNAEGIEKDFLYLSIDLNGLKTTNDTLGHEAGDRLICGSADCMKQAFAARGQIYRIGGDEFAALLQADKAQLQAMLACYEKAMKEWSEKSGIELTTSCGWVIAADYPDKTVDELAVLADEKMYETKARFYRETGRDRRAHSMRAG
ncbi:MAG: GGDEF domain-containing protein [Solobacterium sp.]|nr:GGDEF domain-containing protein [Solobacterium sp.]